MDTLDNISKLSNINATILAGEWHFNQIQHQYRFLASSWLLAFFAALGYVYAAASSPIDKNIIFFFLSLVSAIGLTLIWMLDIKVYHQLL